MGLVSILFFLFCLGLSGFVLLAAYGLSRRYPFRFLTFYFYYLLFFYVYAFIYFVGSSFNILLFLPSTDSLIMALQIVFVLAAPAEIVFLYFLILWIAGLLGRRLPAWLRGAYFLLQFGFFIHFVIRLKRLLDTRSAQLSGPISAPFQVVEVILFFNAMAYLFIGGKARPNDQRNVLARRMALLLLAGYTLSILFGDKISLPFYSNATLMLLFITLLHFVMNVPPLLALKSFLKRHPSGLSGLTVPTPGRTGLERFCAEHRLTRRERDIVELILAGKDTREISRALFISGKTVKNNLSKVFQKTHAKSRVQLIAFIENLRDKP